MGMPTPAGAGMIAAVVHFAVADPGRESIVSLASWWFCSGHFDVEHLRYYSFKDIPWTRRQPSLAIVLVALLVGAVLFIFRDPHCSWSQASIVFTASFFKSCAPSATGTHRVSHKHMPHRAVAFQSRRHRRRIFPSRQGTQAGPRRAQFSRERNYLAGRKHYGRHSYRSRG